MTFKQFCKLVLNAFGVAVRDTHKAVLATESVMDTALRTSAQFRAEAFGHSLEGLSPEEANEVMKKAKQQANELYEALQ